MKSIRQDLGDLLKASYLPEKDAQSLLEKKKYKLDPELSSPETKIFVDESNSPLILHRGTSTVKDIIDDGLVAIGLGKYGHRYKNARRLTKKVEDKYQQPAHAVGHSYGGWLAENSGASGNTLTYNKAVGLGDIGRKKTNRQHDVRTRGDIVSRLSSTQQANTETLKNKHFFKNPITAHDTVNLFY
jgi:hypothetical protein